jgi:hypothetical protein
MVYSENHARPIHSLCGQNADILIIKAGVPLGSKGLCGTGHHIRGNF